MGKAKPLAKAASSGPVRCAVYTRKSSEDGLDQAFNSLHAQREACEAYILSQKHEGWTLVPTAYDDGGYSGGNMERPGLKALLADVAAGLIDTVVVYKVDRLSRALGQFARMVDLFDAQGCSFVSVTQAFNTTTSMGRLTLNMLLSFAQFEREVTGERIRDKIAASKAKGMWMGGVVPLGYAADGRTLKVVEDEAQQVRTLFNLYLTHRSADAVVAEAAARGIRSKQRAGADGGPAGSQPITRGALYRILANRLYVGEIPHKEQVHPGLHDGIVPRATFDAAQALLDEQRRRKRGLGNRHATTLLARLLYNQSGERLTPTNTRKGRQRYHYYAGGSLRVPANDLHALVIDSIAERLADPSQLAALLPNLGLVSAAVVAKAAALAARLKRSSGQRELLNTLVQRIVIEDDQVVITLRLDSLGLAGAVAELACPATIGRQRHRLTLVVPGAEQPAPDPALIGMVAQGRRWFEMLAGGGYQTIAELARAERIDENYVRRVMPAAFMAPDLVTSIVEGRQPRRLTVQRLREMLPLPQSWAEQRALIAKC